MMSKEKKKLDEFEKEIIKTYNIIEKERERKSLFVIIDKKSHDKEQIKDLKTILKKHNSKRYGILPTSDINLVQMIEGEEGYYVHTFIGNKVNISRKSGGRPPNALPPKLPKSAWRE